MVAWVGSRTTSPQFSKESKICSGQEFRGCQMLAVTNQRGKSAQNFDNVEHDSEVLVLVFRTNKES